MTFYEKNKPTDIEVLQKFPVYAALLERIILDNRNGFSVVTDDSKHRSVWYAVLNHYNIKYNKETLKEDYVNGYDIKDNIKTPAFTCIALPPGVYHYKNFCQDCWDVPRKIIDVSTKKINVQPFKNRHNLSHRLFCTQTEKDQNIPGITDKVIIINDKLLNKMHKPTIYTLK